MSNTWLFKKLCTLKSKAICGIATNNDENIYVTLGNREWFGMTGGGLWRLNKDNLNMKPQCLVKDGSEMRGIVWNGNNILYICAYNNHRILQYSIDTGILSTLAGTGISGNQDGKIDVATFSYPQGIAVDRNGDLYITTRNYVRKINLSEGTVETLAGSSQDGYRDGEAKNAMFDRPAGITLSGDGSIYVNDRRNHCVRNIKDGIVSTVAGTPGKEGIEVGPLRDSTFTYPRGLILNRDRSFLVADSNGLRRVDVDQNIVSALIELQDIKDPWSLATDNDGNIYVGTVGEADNEGNTYVGTVGEIWELSKLDESDIRLSLNNMTIWKNVRLFLVGDSGAGKTSVVRWLKGEKFETNHISTNSVDISTVDVNTWQSVTFDIKDYMAYAIKNSKSSFKPAYQVITKKEEMTISLPEIKSPDIPENQFETNSNNEFIQQVTQVRVPLNATQDITQRIKKIQQVSQIFHVWDFAGQEEYYNSHHFFLSSMAVYFVVVDISKLNFDRIQFWINSVQYYAKGAPIIIIGTHKDEVTDTEAIMGKIFEQFELHIYQNSKEYCVAVCCNNKLATFEPPQAIQNKLLDIVTNHRAFQISCKLSWMLFFDQLMDEQNWDKYSTSWNSKNTPETKDCIATVELQKAFELARKTCHITTIEEVKEALKFFCESGFLLYFNSELLEDVIFVQPKNLIHVLRTIITDTKPAVAPNGSYKNIYHTSLSEVQLFKSKGIIRSETLEKLWKNYPPIMQIRFKLLLEKFGLAVPSPEQSVDIIIPCLVETPMENFPCLTKGWNLYTCVGHLPTIPQFGLQNRLIVHILQLVQLTNRKNPNSYFLFKGGCIFPFSGFMTRMITSGSTIILQLQAKQTSQQLVDAFKALFQRINSLANVYQTQLESVFAHCFNSSCSCKDQQVGIQWRDPLMFPDFCCCACNVQQAWKDMMDICDESECHNSGEKRKVAPSVRFTDLVTKHSQIIELCQILDPNELWRSLGEELGKSFNELNWIQTRATPQKTATDLLLSEWKHGKNATVDVLLEALQKINNETAVLLIQNWQHNLSDNNSLH